MSQESLQEIAVKLVVDGKGILAADESTTTIGKRFDKIGVENTEDNRRAYRELLFTAPEMEKYISGVIMYDETIRQSAQTGLSFVETLNEKGVIPGIKVDLGVQNMEDSMGEKITTGLDGLDERLKEYYSLGTRFAKWRAVFSIGEGLPTEKCIQLNAEILAKYAKLCQENNIVPMVEPEVLMDGKHTIDQCRIATEKVLTVVFVELKKIKVELNGILLKPNMVIYSLEGVKTDAGQVAKQTVECLNTVVPHEVPGIVFLSGGQSEEEACENLDMINKMAKNEPWKLSFSYGRALQSSALQTWGGKEENIVKAQQVFLSRAEAASLAALGKLK